MLCSKSLPVLYVVFVWAKFLQSCPTLYNPMDYRLPGSSVGFSRQEYWSGLPWSSPGYKVVILLFFNYIWSYFFFLPGGRKQHTYEQGCHQKLQMCHRWVTQKAQRKDFWVQADRIFLKRCLPVSHRLSFPVLEKSQGIHRKGHLSLFTFSLWSPEN